MSSKAGKLRNLLCAGYSAEYCARALAEAVEILGSEEDELVSAAQDMARRGVERQSLLREEGFYATYEGDDRPMGSQKHPPQLNPIAYLPMADLADDDPAVLTAWRRRYDLTVRARRPHTAGWTIGEFFLSSVRMRDPEEAEKDLLAVQPCRAADPRWIQFYESSFIEGWHLNKAYYFTMSGLYLQAFTDCFVQDWRGYVDLFACLLPGWADCEMCFHGIHTLGGAVVSGRWNAGEFRVEIEPGNQESILVRLSRPGARIAVSGAADGPKEFSGGETVELTFRPNEPIILSGERTND